MHSLPANQGGWLAGLNDPDVGKALRLLHANPVRDWTVEELAREVGPRTAVRKFPRARGVLTPSPPVPAAPFSGDFLDDG